MPSWAEIASDLLKCEGDQRCPELSLELQRIEAAHGELGMDANGRATGEEMRRYFEDNGIDDPGEQEAYRQLWRAMEGEASRIHWERLKDAEEERRTRQ